MTEIKQRDEQGECKERHNNGRRDDPRIGNLTRAYHVTQPQARRKTPARQEKVVTQRTTSLATA